MDINKFRNIVKDIVSSDHGELDEISKKYFFEEMKKAKDLEIIIKPDVIHLCFVSGYSHKKRIYEITLDEYNQVLREEKLKRILNETENY